MTPSDVLAHLGRIATVEGPESPAHAIAARLQRHIDALDREAARALRVAALVGKNRAGDDPGAVLWRALAVSMGETPTYPGRCGTYTAETVDEVAR